MRNINEQSSHLAIHLDASTLPRGGFNTCLMFTEYVMHMNGVMFIFSVGGLHKLRDIKYK